MRSSTLSATVWRNQYVTISRTSTAVWLYLPWQLQLVDMSTCSRKSYRETFWWPCCLWASWWPSLQYQRMEKTSTSVWPSLLDLPSPQVWAWALFWTLSCQLTHLSSLLHSWLHVQSSLASLSVLCTPTIAVGSTLAEHWCQSCPSCLCSLWSTCSWAHSSCSRPTFTLVCFFSVALCSTTPSSSLKKGSVVSVTTLDTLLTCSWTSSASLDACSSFWLRRRVAGVKSGTDVSLLAEVWWSLGWQTYTPIEFPVASQSKFAKHLSKFTSLECLPPKETCSTFTALMEDGNMSGHAAYSSDQDPDDLA